MPTETPPGYRSLRTGYSQRYKHESASPSEQVLSRRNYFDSAKERHLNPSLNELRDTTVNIASAFNQAKRNGSTPPADGRKSTPFNSFRAGPLHTPKHSQDTTYNLYPKLDDSLMTDHSNRRTQSSLNRVDEDPLSTILDNYTNNSLNNSRVVRQLSVSDADLQANPFAEEELLYQYPEEERRRRLEADSRENTPRKSSSRGGTPAFESLDAWRKRIDGLSDLNSTSEISDKQSIRSESSLSSAPNQTFLWQPLQRVLDSTFRWLMFWVFMIFWTIKEAVVTALGLTLNIADYIIATPAIIVLTRLQKLVHFLTGKNLVDEELLEKAKQPSTSVWRRLTRLAPMLFIICAAALLAENTDIPRNVHTSTTENVKSALQSFPLLFERLVNGWQWTPQQELPKSLEELANRVVAMEKHTKVLADTAQKLRQNDNRLEKLEATDAKKVNDLNTRLAELEKLVQSLSRETGKSISTELNKYREGLEEVISDTMDKDNRISKMQQSVEELHVRLKTLTDFELSIATLEQKLNDLQVPSNVEDLSKIAKELENRVSRTEATALLQSQLDNFKQDMLKYIKTGKAVDLKHSALEIVDRKINDALLKYHQDYLSIPDYALASSGARIIPRLTSSTYEIEPADGVKRMIHKIMPLRDTSSAIIALNPDTKVGQCWPMQGSNGSIGILLSKTITVTGVTIEHAGKQVLPDRRSAPKDFAVWAVYGDNLGQIQGDTFGEQSQHSVELATGQYDAEDESALQTFAVDHKKPTRAVVIRINSNWGHPEYTCLYRVRIHGEPISNTP
ncbi:Sad1 and UNC84 domain-containing protein [Umbelopsis sp. WA50703]